MADDNVEVQFGASTEDLVGAVNRAKDAVSGIGNSVDGLGEKLNHLAEAFGVAFSVEALKNFVESMAELGLNTERTAAILGISNEQVVQLSGFAKLTGTDINELSSGIERMSLNIQRSTRDGMNPAAQALKILGLNARELIGLPADQYFLKLADAVSQFNPSLNLTNAVMAVGGRGVAQMLPALQQGAEGFQRFQEEVQKASEGLSQAVPGLADTHEKLTLLGLSAQSLGARIFSAVKPAIDAVVVSMTNWIESFHGDEIRDKINDIGNATIEVGRNIALFFVDMGTAINAVQSNLAYVLGAMTAVAVATKQWQIAAALAAPALLDAARMWGGASSQMQEDADKARLKINQTADAMKASFNTAVPRSGTWEAQVADMKALSDQVGDAVTQYLRLNAAQINMGAGDQLKAEIANLNTMVAAQNSYYEQQVQHINQLASTYQISESQKTAMLLAALQQREDFQRAELQQGMGLQGLTQTQYQSFQDELTKITNKANLDRQKINAEAVAQYQKQWTTALNTIESSFNSQLRGLLAGTTTWSQAFKNILGDIIIKFIEMCEEMVVKWAAAQLAQTTAATTGAAARTAAETTSASAGILASAANAMRMIMQDAGQAFAGVFAFLAPVMGPAAAGPAAAAEASVSAAAIFDLGTPEIMRSGLAIVHQGEAIVPAWARGSGPWTGGNTAPTVHAPVSISVSALDSQSVARFFGDNSKHMLRAINDAVKRGAHLGMRSINR